MSDIVYVVKAWNERTEKQTLLAFADKAKADKAWEKLQGEQVWGGVFRRTVKR